jgi:hypothetical protein
MTGKYRFRFDSEPYTAAFLCKICGTFKKTMIKAKIWEAVPEAGVEFDASVEPYLVRFEEEKSKGIPGCQGISRLNFLLVKLSVRRQITKFNRVD